MFGAGLAVGLLLAPKTGRGARSWLGQKADHLRHNVFDIRERAKREANFQQGRLAGAVHRLRQVTGSVESEKEVFVDDDLITQRVRTKIGEHPQTYRIPRVNVDTANGIVTLRGRTESKTEKQALENVAGAVPAVEGVINKVTVARRQAM